MLNGIVDPPRACHPHWDRRLRRRSPVDSTRLARIDAASDRCDDVNRVRRTTDQCNGERAHAVSHTDQAV
jgi:hypothetical protein